MKTAIVTGAAGDIGTGIAKVLAAAGYKVGMIDLEERRVRDAAAKVPGAVPLAANVIDEASVEAALAKFGDTPDLAVNNAGIVQFGYLLDQSLEDFKRVLDVDLVGVFVVGRACARRMVQRGSGGAIVNITSIGGMACGTNAGAYPAAKAGAAKLTEQMALEWGPQGIRVNAIAPGFIDAGMSAGFFKDPKIRARRGNAVPLRRLGTAEDVARAVLFLGSDEASYISGQHIAVDGGVVHSVLLQLPRD
jgi:NAD(P)-dependent dehydrogenase (short-subunit alcohol dehydrogenase family)